MFMSDKELTKLVQCPRCREHIPLTRKYYNNGEGILGCHLYYGGLGLSDTVITTSRQEATEISVLFATVVGQVDDPESIVRNGECRGLLRYTRQPSATTRIDCCAHDTPLKKFPPQNRVLGVVFK